MTRTRRIGITLVGILILSSAFGGGAAAAGLQRLNLKHDEGRPIIQPLPSSFPVFVRQTAAQADPAAGPPISFDVIFAVPIAPATFEPGDIVQNGTATGLAWNITPGVDDQNFTIVATALDASATPVTVIPTIAAASVATAGTCTAASDNPGDPCGIDADCPNGACTGGAANLSSVSIDNSVTVGAVSCATTTYLYLAVWSPPLIYSYCVEADGTLTFEEHQAAPGDNRDLEINPGGQHLYYASSDLTKYYVSLDGSLALAGTVAVGSGVLYDLAFSPNGQYLYGTHSGDKLYAYDIGVTTLPLEIQVVSGLIGPHGVVATDDFVYVANQWSFLGDPDTAEEIVTFPRNSNGTLDPGGATHTDGLARPDFFALHPTLPLLYHTDRPGASVVIGEIDGGTVTEVGFSPVFSGFGATQLVMDAAGTRLYVLNLNEDNVSVFEIDGVGDLTLLETEHTGARPEHVVIHPDQDYVYVASAGNGSGPSTLKVFRVEAAGLHPVQTLSLPDQGAYRLAILVFD